LHSFRSTSTASSMLERYGIYFDTSKLVFYNNSGSEQTLMVFFCLDGSLGRDSTQ
jgi:hypothetical protein